MKNQILKDKIILHCKGLKSKRKKIYQMSLNFLVGMFFENDLNCDEMDILDQYQVIQAIFLSLIKGLLEENDYENLATIRDIYFSLQLQVVNELQDPVDLECYELSNEFFVLKMNEIIGKTK